MYWDPYQSAELTESQRASRKSALLKFRQYQEPVFWSGLGMLILHWSRQIGKSYVLAAWAVRRLLKNPGRLVSA